MAPELNEALDAQLEDDPHTGPLRRCLVTRQSAPRETMLRFVLGPEQMIVFDAAATLPGRGMWLSASGVVIESAVKRGVFARAAKAQVTLQPELRRVITERLQARLFDLLGLARRSGAAVAGFEKAGELLASGKAGVVLQASDGSAPERARFLGAREVPVVDSLSAARLGQVFGREHVVHVAVASGRLARMIEIEAARLAGVAGETASGQLGPNAAERALTQTAISEWTGSGMSDGNDQIETKGRLSLRPATPGSGGHKVDAGSVRQSFSHGRSKVVQVEVVKRRGVPGAAAPAAAAGAQAPLTLSLRPQVAKENLITPPPVVAPQPAAPRPRPGATPRALTPGELATRQRVLGEQQKVAAAREAERREQESMSILSAAEEARRREDDAEREAVTAKREISAPAEVSEAAATIAGEPVVAHPPAPAAPTVETLRLKPGGIGRPAARVDDDDETPRGVRRPSVGAAAKRGAPVVAPKKIGDDRRRAGKIDVQAALDGEDEKVRSLASVRRQRERERRQAELELLRADGVKVVREVILPETITVQELANRMAARGNEVVKSLMKMGVMATITQAIDADTAELVINEFGHRARRVADSDVEAGLEGETDTDTDLLVRPPVVTIMGHVDHGKTSLLDALRHTDVAAREAGGITQHIGAYQVKLPTGAQITFLDTPGHEAFTAMRARGAGVTDIVVLVVAADDGVMPQTVEAIKHAKAANVPIIVAVNKIDRPGADANRVRQELLQYEVVVEEMGGETQDVEVSALKKTGLDKLEEAILLQAEVLELRANPDRSAEGAVIESRLDKGRGPVATVLVQKGTLKAGDIVVAGTQWGRVRAMQDDKGKPVAAATPSTPVEILGLSAAPTAGEPFVVVESDVRAREIVEYRSQKQRERSAAAATAGRGTMEEMLARIQAGAQKEVALVVKADVQGSAEAINVVVTKVGNEEVRVRVLYSGVGQITESDVQLAKASDAIVVGFNVRANTQARELATRDAVDIRYFSIIYEVADDIEKLVKGRLAPVHRERFLGYAEIRQVFNITKTGKVAGCYVTEGLVKRGAGVRLLRDNVVIHQGDLSQLKRFKDDVKEVARGYECGLSFAGFQDLKEGDVVECYETEIVAA